MNLHLTTPCSTEINPQEEIKAAMRHIHNALYETGIGKTPPISKIQAIRLKDAQESLRKSLLER